MTIHNNSKCTPTNTVPFPFQHRSVGEGGKHPEGKGLGLDSNDRMQKLVFTANLECSAVRGHRDAPGDAWSMILRGC